MSNDFGLSSEEKIQALQLISERRRISFDLLKAHFGSSAKATNAISCLEMNGFINKPEGSERWEILYDKIEKYLSDKGISLDEYQENEDSVQFDTVYQPNESNNGNKSEWKFKILNTKIIYILSLITGAITGISVTYCMHKKASGLFLLSLLVGIIISIILALKSIDEDRDNGPFLCIGLAVIGFMLFGIMTHANF